MAEQRAKFTQMKDGDAEDYSIIAASNAKDYDHLADKVITHLKMLQNDYGGFQVDRLPCGAAALGTRNKWHVTRAAYGSFWERPRSRTRVRACIPIHAAVQRAVHRTVEPRSRVLPSAVPA